MWVNNDQECNNGKGRIMAKCCMRVCDGHMLIYDGKDFAMSWPFLILFHIKKRGQRTIPF